MAVASIKGRKRRGKRRELEVQDIREMVRLLQR
jgi:hypothetical protein